MRRGDLPIAANNNKSDNNSNQLYRDSAKDTEKKIQNDNEPQRQVLRVRARRPPLKDSQVAHILKQRDGNSSRQTSDIDSSGSLVSKATTLTALNTNTGSGIAAAYSLDKFRAEALPKVIEADDTDVTDEEGETYDHQHIGKTQHPRGSSTELLSSAVSVTKAPGKLVISRERNSSKSQIQRTDKIPPLKSPKSPAVLPKKNFEFDNDILSSVSPNDNQEISSAEGDIYSAGASQISQRFPQRSVQGSSSIRAARERARGRTRVRPGNAAVEKIKVDQHPSPKEMSPPAVVKSNNLLNESQSDVSKPLPKIGDSPAASQKNYAKSGRGKNENASTEEISPARPRDTLYGLIPKYSPVASPTEQHAPSADKDRFVTNSEAAKNGSPSRMPQSQPHATANSKRRVQATSNTVAGRNGLGLNLRPTPGPSSSAGRHVKAKLSVTAVEDSSDSDDLSGEKNMLEDALEAAKKFEILKPGMLARLVAESRHSRSSRGLLAGSRVSGNTSQMSGVLSPIPAQASAEQRVASHYAAVLARRMDEMSKELLSMQKEKSEKLSYDGKRALESEVSYLKKRLEASESDLKSVAKEKEQEHGLRKKAEENVASAIARAEKAERDEREARREAASAAASVVASASAKSLEASRKHKSGEDSNELKSTIESLEMELNGARDELIQMHERLVTQAVARGSPTGDSKRSPTGLAIEQAQIATLREALAALKQEHRNMLDEHDSVLQRNAVLGREVRDMKEVVGLTMARSAASKEDESAHTSEARRLRRKISELEESVKTLHDEISKARAENEDSLRRFQIETSKLNDELDDKSRENRSLSERILTLESSINQLSNGLPLLPPKVRDDDVNNVREEAAKRNMQSESDRSGGNENDALVRELTRKIRDLEVEGQMALEQHELKLRALENDHSFQLKELRKTQKKDMQKLINDLEEQVEQRAKEHDEELNARTKKYEALISELKAEVARLTAKTPDETKNSRSLFDNAAVRKLELEIQTQKSEIAELEKRNNVLEASLLEESTKRTDALVVAKSPRRSDASTDTDVSEEDIANEKTRQDLEVAKKRLEGLETELEQAKGKCSESQALLEELQGAYNKLQAKLASSLEQLHDEHDGALGMQKRDFDAALDKARKEIQETRSQFESERAQFSTDVEALRADIASLEKSEARATAEVEGLSREFERLISNSMDYEAERARRERLISELQTQVHDLRAQVEDARLASVAADSGRSGGDSREPLNVSAMRKEFTRKLDEIRDEHMMMLTQEMKFRADIDDELSDCKRQLEKNRYATSNAGTQTLQSASICTKETSN